MKSQLAVIMPCKQEADNLTVVIGQLKKLNPIVIVVGLDPSTTDDTAVVSKKLGCKVVYPKRSGYDDAVYTATNYVLDKYPEALLLYTDAGDKYGYEQVPEMVKQIEDGADMVLAVRRDDSNTMRWHQKLGTQIILKLINVSTHQHISDISPFRIVSPTVFSIIEMDPKKFRWPSELLVKALALKLRVSQVEVAVRPRKGNSKVSASLKSSARAGIEMFSSLSFVNYEGRAKL